MCPRATPPASTSAPIPTAWADAGCGSRLVVTAPQLGHARQRAVPMPRTISSSASAAAHRLRYLGFPWSIASGMRRHRYWRSSADCLGHHGGYRQTGCIRLPRWHHIVQLVVRAADCRYHLRRFLDAKPHGVQAIGLPRQVFVRHLPVALAVVDSFQRPCPEDLQGSRALASHHDRVAHRHCGDDFLADGGETGGNALGGIRRGAPSHEQEESCGPGYCR